MDAAPHVHRPGGRSTGRPLRQPPVHGSGLALQAIGYAWVAGVATAAVEYMQLGAAFTVAGIGTSFCFPTVANAIMGSVPMQEAGVAPRTNSALRELGGVVGVAILASVFIHHGGYTSPHAFMDGFGPAIWVAVGLSALGIVAATFTAGHGEPGRIPIPVAAAHARGA